MMLVMYLATHYTRQSATKLLPYHFTIPISSPFTSVVRFPRSLFFSSNHRDLVAIFQVEHETSVMGTKVVTMIVLVLAALAYLYIQHRFLRSIS